LEIHVSDLFQNGLYRRIALRLILCCGVQVVNESKVYFYSTEACARFARARQLIMASNRSQTIAIVKSPG
jgi:hypothetical protein